MDQTTFTATGEGARGLVRITLDDNGQMTEVVINPRARRLDSHDLAAGVQEAFTAANAGLREAILARSMSRGADAEADADADAEAEAKAKADAEIEDVIADAESRLTALTELAAELAARVGRER